MAFKTRAKFTKREVGRKYTSYEAPCLQITTHYVSVRCEYKYGPCEVRFNLRSIFTNIKVVGNDEIITDDIA